MGTDYGVHPMAAPEVRACSGDELVPGDCRGFLGGHDGHERLYASSAAGGFIWGANGHSLTLLLFLHFVTVFTCGHPKRHLLLRQFDAFF